MAQLITLDLYTDSNLQGYWRVESSVEINSISALLNDANLQGYWRLEDVTDESDNNYNLTNNNSVTFSAAKFSNGGNFNGSNQYLSIAHASAPNLETTGDQTFSAWIKPDTLATGTSVSVMAKVNSSANTGRSVQIDDTTGKLNFRSFKIGDDQSVLSSNGVIAGVWNHIAVVYDETGYAVSLYVNGVKTTGSFTRALVADSDTFAIGRLGGLSGQYFDGMIDDCAFWDRVLTEDEIFEIYKTGKDESDNKYHIGAMGAPVNTTGRYGDGIDLESADSQYLVTPNASCPNLEITGSQTWSCWIKPESKTGADFCLMGKSIGGAPYRQIYVNSIGTLYFTCSGLTTNESVSIADPLTLGEWHHIVGVYDSSATKLKLFVNGQKTEVTASGSMTSSSADFWIGRYATGGYFDGVIDDVAVFNRALSDDEVAELYAQRFTVTAKAYLWSVAAQTIQAKANISEFNHTTQTVTVKARISEIVETATVTGLQAVARISPSQDFLDEVDATVREIDYKLEVQWDGASWTDESDYFVSAKANEKLSETSGEGIASTLDVELQNTTERFTPGNSSSPIYAYLKPRVAIRLSMIMGGYTYRMFTGYIKNIHPSYRTKVCSLECYDNQVLVYNKRANGIVYQDKRSDQLLSTLAELAGLTDDQFSFDIGTHIVNFGYFEDRNVWPIMGEIAVAERGRVFFDRDGILKFWNRDKLHNRHAAITVSLEDHITDLDYSVSEHEIKNAVIVQATPRASAGVKVVWSSGNAEYLNPYTDTLVWIPANNSQVATLELDDPCTTFITPIKNTDYTANSAQDGTGDDLTDNIVINEFVNYGNAVFISVLNIGDTDAYLTKFQVRGNPAEILKWIRVTSTDDESIDNYGRQEFKIENNFIDSEDSAREISEEELYRRKDSVNLFRINIVGIPHLLCGDVINVEHQSGVFKEFMINEMTWDLDDGGFRQKLTLVNPYIFPTRKTIDARANIVAALKTVLSKARIKGAKNIVAKGSIKLNTTRTVTGKGKIDT